MLCGTYISGNMSQCDVTDRVKKERKKKKETPANAIGPHGNKDGGKTKKGHVLFEYVARKRNSSTSENILFILLVSGIF